MVSHRVEGMPRCSVARWKSRFLELRKLPFVWFGGGGGWLVGWFVKVADRPEAVVRLVAVNGRSRLGAAVHALRVERRLRSRADVGTSTPNVGGDQQLNLMVSG